MWLELKTSHLLVVGTRGFEPRTPTVSRKRAGAPAPASLIESDGGRGSDMGNKGTDGGLLTHGVPIASLAHDVLNDPEATVREVALAGWVLHELERRGDEGPTAREGDYGTARENDAQSTRVRDRNVRCATTAREAIGSTGMWLRATHREFRSRLAHRPRPKL